MSPDSKRDFANQIASEHFQALQAQNPEKSPAEKLSDLAQSQILGRVSASLRAYMVSDRTGLADRVAAEQARFDGRKPGKLRGLLRFFRR